MSTRVIKVKTLKSSLPVSIKTDVRTFGEFKQLSDVKSLGIDWSSSKLIDRQTKHSFEIDSALLPEIDCIVFQTPTKSKSGTDWSNVSYKELKSTIKGLKDSGVVIPFNYTNASSETMSNFLKEYDKNNDKQKNEPKEEAMDTCKKSELSVEEEVEVLVNEVSQKLNRLKELASKCKIKEVNVGPKQEDIIELVTIEDLDREFAEIQKELR